MSSTVVWSLADSAGCRAGRKAGKHLTRALQENARQSFQNGARPPIGNLTVAAETRGAKVKKKLEIDPLHAETVRRIDRLVLEGCGPGFETGVKNIVSHLNRNRIFTRDGGRWGIGQVHRALTRRSHIGEHEFNRRAKSKAMNPESDVVLVPVPAILDRATGPQRPPARPCSRSRQTGDRGGSAHQATLRRDRGGRGRSG